MAGFLQVANSQVFHSFKNEEIEGLENGMWVVPDYESGTVKLAEAGDVGYFVENEITTPETYGEDKIDFVVKKGKYVRAHLTSAGEKVVTTVFDENLKVGDKVDFDGGKLVAGDGYLQVAEKTTAFGAPAVSVVHTAVVPASAEDEG